MKPEEKWRSLVENVPDIIMVVDRDGTIQFINHTVSGMAAEQVIGKKLYDYISAEHHEITRRYVEQVFQTGVGKSYELRGAGPHGTTSWYWSCIGPIKDGGDVIAASIITRDITERKKTEELVKESEQRLRAIFDNAADGIVTADMESRKFHTCNKKFCEMLGYSEQEIKNMGVEDIHPKESLSYVTKQFEKQARGEFTLAKNMPVQRKNGSIFYVDINAMPVSLKGKEHLMGIFRDVTEYKKAEEALQQSEVKYRTLLENLPQKIFLKDKSSVYISCNENYAADLKIKAEEITGKTDYDFHPRELAEKYRADDKEIIESGQTKDIEETYIQDGQERIIHTVKTPVKDEQGNAMGILGIFRDITEIKRTQEELDMYREQMTRAERLASLGTLSATVAHELTQPLTVIRLAIENSIADLKKNSCPDSMMEDLKKGLSEVSNATSIVNRFRNFARESPEKSLSKVDLKVIAERIVDLLEERARRAKVTLQVEKMTKLPPVYSNEKDLEQLFFALVENAIQAADRKKNHRLIISGHSRDDHYVELRFADNCGGIAPENIDRIFDPFFTTRPQGEGTGLGLCIVQQIVSRAGGKVRVQNKTGEGSTFLVTLPINPG